MQQSNLFGYHILILYMFLSCFSRVGSLGQTSTAAVAGDSAATQGVGGGGDSTAVAAGGRLSASPGPALGAAGRSTAERRRPCRKRRRPHSPGDPAES